MIETLLALGLKLLYPALGAGVAYLGEQLRRLIVAKTKGAATRAIFMQLEDALETAVQSVQQEVVDDLKRAASDGKLTKADAMRAKTEAIRRAKVYLTEQGLADAKKVLGLSADAAEQYLADKLEQVVGRYKSYAPPAVDTKALVAEAYRQAAEAIKAAKETP
jgi:pyruvate-formate lyase